MSKEVFFVVLGLLVFAAISVSLPFLGQILVP